MNVRIIVSLLLCTTMVHSAAWLPASAQEEYGRLSVSDNEETKLMPDIPTGDGNISRSDLVSLVFNYEPVWLTGMEDKIQFIDFNFDGTPEFVVKDYFPSGQVWVYQVSEGELVRSHFTFGDDETLYNVGENGTFKAMFDNNTGKYRMFGTYHKHNVSDPYYHEYENAELFFDGKNIESRVYSVVHYDGYEFGEDSSKFVYYDGEKNEITKSEYEFINSKQKENCIDVNMKFDTYEMERDQSQQSSYEKMNTEEKLDILYGLYDSFTYDTYVSPDALDCTAEQLLNKPISEIIDMLGGEYYIDGGYQYKVDMRDDHVWSQIYIYNNQLLPGIQILLPTNLFDSSAFSGNKVTESEKTRLRSVLPNASEKPGMVLAKDGAKVNSTISSDMKYSDLTTYFGEFECLASGGFWGYFVKNNNDEIIAEIAFDTGRMPNISSPNVDAATMRSIDPQIYYILIYPSYITEKNNATIGGFEYPYGIGCGESKTLNVTFEFDRDISSDNYNFVYTSGNESVASIREIQHSRTNNKTVSSEVEITGVSGGTAALTVRETTTGAEKSFEVTVFNGSEFNIGEDNYSFTNDVDYFYSDTEATIGLVTKSLPINISDDVLKRLLNHTVDNSERQKIMREHFCLNSNGIWNGSCFGMSSSMAIKFIDSSRLPSRIINEKNPPEYINEWPSPVKSQNTGDVVNYYQLSLQLNHYNNLKYSQLREISSDYSKAVKTLVEQINDTNVPIVGGVAYVKNINGEYSSQFAHAILLIRIKDENEDYYLIECYDPNEMKSFKELKLYKKPSDADDEYSNLLKISYTNTQGTELNFMTSYYSGLSIIDKYNFLSETSSDGTERITDEITLREDSGFTVVADNNTIIENGRSADSSVYGPVPSQMGFLADSDDSDTNSVSYYTDYGNLKNCSLIHKETANPGYAEVVLSNHMFSLNTSKSGNINFNDSTGEINVSMDQRSDYTVSVTDNNNICDWEWFTLTVNATDSKELTVQFTDDGALVSGDNLNNTEITVNNISDESTLTIEEDTDKVMIKNADNEIIAEEVTQDSDSDSDSDSDTSDIDYLQYIKDNVVPQYGEANIENIDENIQMSESIFSLGWSDRKGVFGYNTVDMNKDGKNDLLVYIFDDTPGSNTIKCQYYQLDKDENGSSVLTLKGEEEMCKDMPFLADYMNAGIINISEDTYLYTESFHHDIGTDHMYVEYNMYTVDGLGNFYLKYTVRQSEPANSDYEYNMTEYIRNVIVGYEWEGEPFMSLRKEVKSIYETQEDTLVWNDECDFSIASGIEQKLNNIISVNSKSTMGEVLKKLGFMGYTEVKGENYPENFPSYSDAAAPLFTYVNAPENLAQMEGFMCKYKNMIIFNGLSDLSGNSEDVSPSVKLGDVNSDSKITAKDSMLIQRYTINLAQLDETQKKAADVNGDGKVTAKDALSILRYTIGFRVEGLS